MKNFLENVFFVEIAWKIFVKTFFFGDRLKNFCEALFFFFFEHLRLCPWSLALASSIPVLGLESVCPRKGYPWPRPRIFFCVLGLGLEPCVLDSTSDSYVYFICIKANFSKTNVPEMFCSFNGRLVFKFICFPKCAYQWWIDTTLSCLGSTWKTMKTWHLSDFRGNFFKNEIFAVVDLVYPCLNCFCLVWLLICSGIYNLVPGRFAVILQGLESILQFTADEMLFTCESCVWGAFILEVKVQPLSVFNLTANVEGFVTLF